MNKLAVATLLTLVASVPAHAVDWEEAIRKVSESQRAYREYAVELGGTSWAGTMYNGYMYSEHQCAILGRMLGQAEAIRALEEFDYPPMTPSADVHELLVFSISLENWVAAARKALDATEAQRANIWNLECVGHFGITNGKFVESDAPNADFVVDGGRMSVYGDIEPGFADRFEAALNANPGITEVILGSRGGSVVDALRAGLMIRERGIDTTLHGNCFSACPIVFIAGVERVLWAAPARLGFHQIYVGDGTALPISDPIYAALRDYLLHMGVEPYTVIGWMQMAGPEEMYIPKPSEMCGPRVATFVQRVCSSDGAL